MQLISFKFQYKVWQGILVTSIIAMCFIVLNRGFIGKFINNHISVPINFKMRVLLSQSPTVHPMLKIYAFDDNTLEYVSDDDLKIEEWGKLIQAVAAVQPQSIYINKLFSTPQITSDPNEFIRMMSNVRTPLISASFVSKNIIHGKTPINLNNHHYFNIGSDSSKKLDRSPNPSIEPMYLYGPNKKIMSAFKKLGHSLYNGNGVIQPLIQIKENAAIAHMAFLGNKELNIKHGKLYLNEQQVYLNKDRELPINLIAIEDLQSQTFSLKNSIIRIRKGLSFDNVLKPGQTILILPGMYTGNTDMVNTPVGYMPGGYLLASVINSTLFGNWLMPVGYEPIFILIIASLGFFMGSISSPLIWMFSTITTMTSISFAGILTFAYKGYIIPWELYSSVLFSVSAYLFSWNWLIQHRNARDEKIKNMERHQAAQAVQESLIPDASSIKSIEYHAFYRSAEVTGGDWYGIYEAPTKGQIYLFIGDVTGHGFSAALVTAAVAGCIKTTLLEVNEQYISSPDSLQLLVKHVNSVVFQTGAKAKHLMTMAFICFDLDDSKMYYLNAGHRNIFHISRGQPKIILQGGSVLGFTEDFFSEVQEYPIEKDDIFFFFTDGLTENMGPQGKSLTKRKLLSIISHQNDVTKIVHDVEDATRKIWQNSALKDDCTYFCVKIKDVSSNILTSLSAS